MDLELIVKKIIDLAKNVGEYQLDNFRRMDLKIESKSSEIDFVTEVDKKSEEMIIKFIKSRFIGHSIVAEESGEENTGSDYTWFVDPLDGTNNYAHGIPYFCISIGLRHKEETIVGVVHAPYLRETFYAIKGKGAYLNDKKLEIGRKDMIGYSVVGSGFPYDRKTNPNNNVNFAAKIIPEVLGFRRFGASALDLSYTAAGFLDGFWEMNLKPWDVEAGTLIVNEANGLVKNFMEERDLSIVAGNKEIVCEIEKLINEVK